MFGFFRKKKPKNALDELIFAMYGNPPPSKRAKVGQAIDIANELLLESIDEKEVSRQAIALNEGPIPYSTHDLGISIALNFFQQPENVSQLFDAQLLARLKVIEWLEQGLVAPMLVQSFENTLYRLYKPEDRKPEFILYDQEKIIDFDDEILAWVDDDSGLMWEVKSAESINFMYVWHKKMLRDVDEKLKAKFEPEVHDCTSYVERMNAERYAGFEDWRLPTVEELESLINENGEGRYIKNPLRHNTCPAYWSDTPSMVVNVYRVPGADWKDTAHIPGVKIVDYIKPGVGNYDTRNTLWVRCVRSTS